MEELFLIEIASTEKQFIYNEGVNKGHSLSYSKINRCLFISSDAKQLYHNICDYAYGDKRNCFPSHQSLMFELGWGLTKLKDILKELKETNLIKVKTVPGKSSIYSIQELHKVPVLYHSELIYTLIESSKSQGRFDQKDFNTKFNKYKESNLFKEVSSSSNPLEFKSALWDMFFEPNNNNNNNNVKAPSKLKKRDLNIVPTELNNLNRTNEDEPMQRRTKKKSQDSVIKGLNSFDEDSNKVDLSVPKEEWGFMHLFKYFNKKYEDKYGNLPPSTVVDGVNLKRIIKRKSPLRVVTDIDTYFKLEVFTTHSMHSFCSQWVQTTLDAYLNSGKLPSYKKNTGTLKANIEQDSDMDAWSAGLESIFDF